VKLRKLGLVGAVEPLDLVVDDVVVKADVMVADYDQQLGFSARVEELLDTLLVISPLK